jgi:hypothetical protein
MLEGLTEDLQRDLISRGVYIQDLTEQVHSKARLTLAIPVTLGAVVVQHSAFIGRYTYTAGSNTRRRGRCCYRLNILHADHTRAPEFGSGARAPAGQGARRVARTQCIKFSA